MSARKLAYWATLGFVFSLPWENTVRFSQLGRVSRVLGLLIFGLWLVVVLKERRMRTPHRFHGVLGLFIVWGGISLFWSVDPGSTVSGFFTFGQLLVMTLILWNMLRTKKAIQAGLQAYVLGAWVSAASLIYTFLSSGPAKFAAHERYTIGGFEVNSLALILAMAIPAAWYLAVDADRASPLWMRLANFSYLPVAAFAMVLTGTRGAAVASVPTAMFILWSVWRGNWRTRVAAMGLLSAAALLMVGLAPPEMLGRIGTAVTELSSAGHRGEVIWRRSFDVFLQHPVAGVGLDAHRAAVPLGFYITRGVAHTLFGKEAHNVVISILVETGMIGFGILVTMAVILVKSVSRMSGLAAGYWAAQLGVIAIGAQSLSIEDSKAVWLFFALTVAASVAVGFRSVVLTRPSTSSLYRPSKAGAHAPVAAHARSLQPATGRLENY
ncbi:MAG: O-antigen ligase family protein [Actinomycetota bacterium]